MRTPQENVTPNLMRHIFPSYRPPMIHFAEGTLPTRIPKAAWCVDCTLSVGRAALDVLTPAEMGELFVLLNHVNAKSGLIRQAEILVGGAPEHEALESILQGRKTGELQIEPVAVIQPHVICLEPLRGLDLKRVAILFGASDPLVLKGGTSRVEAVRRLMDVIEACTGAGFQVRLDLLDVTRADIEDFVLPLLADCVDHLAALGGSHMQLRLCDSLGLGIPWPESPLPRSIPRLVHNITANAKISFEQLEFMGHNDLGLALANTMSAMMHGACGVGTSFAGLGQRSGVAPTELMLLHLSGHYGVEHNRKAIGDVLEFLEQRGAEVPATYPLWGERALVRSYPPVQDATLEPVDLPGPFDTLRILGIGPTTEIRRESGGKALAYLIRQQLPDAELADDDPRLLDLLAWIDEEQMDRITWFEIVDKVQELLPGLWQAEEEQAPGEEAGEEEAAEEQTEEQTEEEQTEEESTSA